MSSAEQTTPLGRDAAEAREHMVEHQLRRRGSFDERVLGAMSRVRRERFVPEELRHLAYEDGALAIGGGQTISQPFMVATICQLLGLTGDERVLDVGTGSGYQAAVLAELAAQVVTIERIPALAERARAALAKEGYADIEVLVGDGSLGASAWAPFDGIAVAAAAPAIPPALVEQLAETRSTRRPAWRPVGSASRARRAHRGWSPRARRRVVQIRAARRCRGVFGWPLLAQWGIDATALPATLRQSWRPLLRTCG